MATIGQFRTIEGGYEGTISTLSMARKVRFVPNEKKKTDASPDYFVKTGKCDLGFAKRKMSEGDNPRSYLSVFLDDPSFAEPIWAALFESDGKADLVWSRSKTNA
ncbi:MAG: DUF736 domain-containing protein [Pseudomonadota bacterium]